jgi:hypothetical protein
MLDERESIINYVIHNASEEYSASILQEELDQIKNMDIKDQTREQIMALQHYRVNISLKVADLEIGAKFYAENIAFSSSNLINEADQSINNQFNAEQ